MRKLLVLSLLLTACQGNLSEAELDTLNTQGVIGGTEVSVTERTAKQALNFRVLYDPLTVHDVDSTRTIYKVSQCTASAIAPRLILTAAHCISSRQDAEHRIELKDTQGQVTAIKSIKNVVHPEYLKGNKQYDLALVHLETALPEDIEILKLPNKVLPLPMYSIKAGGFGRSDGRPSVEAKQGILRKVDLNVIEYSVVSPVFKVDQTQGKGVCKGDSGGPAILEYAGETLVVGVVSKTYYNDKVAKEELNQCNFQGEYINVQFHMDWLLSESFKLSLE